MHFRATAFVCVGLAAGGFVFMMPATAQDSSEPPPDAAAATAATQPQPESTTSADQPASPPGQSPTTTEVVHVPEAPPAPPAKESSDYQLETVEVTAQRRTEALNKVPIAISAFDQKSMDKIGTSSMAGSFNLVPNMQNGTGGLTVRGVGTTAITSTAPTVAIYFDGVYADNDPRGLGGNWDIARVEVLRGPQGTLYGRNATAGAVNLISAQPSDHFEGFGDVSYGIYNDKQTRFVINQPIGETFGLRLAATYDDNDGFSKNTVPGESNAGAGPSAMARLAARWAPTFNILWNANVQFGFSDGVDSGFQADWYVSKPDTHTAIVYPSGLAPTDVPPQGPGADMFGNFARRNSANNRRTYNLRSNLRYSVDNKWTLTWIAGGFLNNGDRSNNNSLPLALVDHSLRGNDSKAVTQLVSNELDLNFEGEAMHAVAGLYDFRKRSQEENIFHIWTPAGSSGPSSPPQLSGAIDIGNQAFEPNRVGSQAIFGQLTVDVTDLLRMTGGLRYTRDTAVSGEGRSTYCQFGDISDPDNPPSQACQALDASGQFGGIFGPTELPHAEKGWHNLSWKATADYDITPELLGYGTVSTGYKQGAITGSNPGGVQSVEPETNTNYEVGLRSPLFDGRAYVNFTAFWMDYVNLQVSKSDIVNGAPTITLQNVGKARSRGVETEFSWLLTTKDRIDGYVTYLNAVVTKFPGAPDTLRGAAFTFDAAGKQLPFAPKSTFRIAYSHGFDLGSWGKLTPNLSTFYSTKDYIQVTNEEPDLNKAYSRSDAFLRYTTPEEKFSVDAFVNNIENHYLKVNSFAFLSEACDAPCNSSVPPNPNGTPGGGVQWNQYTDGRTMGLRLGMRFK